MLLLLFLATNQFFLWVLLLLLFAFGSIRTISGYLSIWVLVTGSLKVVREDVTVARDGWGGSELKIRNLSRNQAQPSTAHGRRGVKGTGSPTPADMGTPRVAFRAAPPVQQPHTTLTHLNLVSHKGVHAGKCPERGLTLSSPRSKVKAADAQNAGLPRQAALDSENGYHRGCPQKQTLHSGMVLEIIPKGLNSHPASMIPAHLRLGTDFHISILKLCFRILQSTALPQPKAKDRAKDRAKANPKASQGGEGPSPQLSLPGTDVPRATNTTAVTESFKPMVQPKWDARSPMKAVSRPIIRMETTKQAQPFQ